MFLPKTHECKVLTFLKLVVSKAFFFLHQWIKLITISVLPISWDIRCHGIENSSEK